MIPQTTISWQQQFKTKHGDSVEINGILWFKDGAWCEPVPWGASKEPPEDHFERWRRIATYREVKLARATNTFNEMKRALEFRAKEAIRWAAAKAPPEPPSPDDIAKLKEAQKVVHHWQMQLDDARKELEANKPQKLKDRETRAAANHLRNAAAVRAIEEITI